MRRPVVRLVGVVATLGVAALVVLLLVPVSGDGVRTLVETSGAFAPLVFVVVAALLALAFVPGPLLSGVSGALFGTGLGFVATVASATLTAVLAVHVARRSAGSAVTEVSGPRARALADLARRRGTLVVVLQRLVPGIPDVPFSYLFGAIGLRSWQVALGTLLGSAPRAFAYTALGDAAATGNGRLAAVATVVAVGVSVVGAVAGSVVVQRHRAAGAGGTDPAPAVNAPTGRQAPGTSLGEDDIPD